MAPGLVWEVTEKISYKWCHVNGNGNTNRGAKPEKDKSRGENKNSPLCVHSAMYTHTPHGNKSTSLMLVYFPQIHYLHMQSTSYFGHLIYINIALYFTYSN